jgi:hypothetical protein
MSVRVRRARLPSPAMARRRLFVWSAVLVALGPAIAGCTTPSKAATTGTRASTTTASPKTASPKTAAAPPPTTTTAESPSSQFLGPHDFTVAGVRVSSTGWLTVELHPTTAPIQLRATSTSPLEVCPANLDGTISGSGSWPPGFKFVSCSPFDGAGVATLPPSDGSFHLAFAVRPVATAGSASVTLAVDYSAVDTFVAVIPPVATGNLDMTVTFVPGSSTIGDVVTPEGMADTVAAPGFVATARQGDQTLSSPAACDFATELSSCVRGVVPNEPLSVNVGGPGAAKVDVSLAWK